jgi:hypothetical protein
MDNETATALAHLAPNAIITIQVRAADYAKAVQEMEGGPAELTPGQAAKRFGRSAKYWRAQAAAGAINGAYLDGETERWYLPNNSCQAHLAAKARPSSIASRRTRRGPRKAKST